MERTSNIPVTTPALVSGIDPSVLRAAQAQAAVSGRRVVVELEALHGRPADAFVVDLGATLHYRTMDRTELLASAPDFSAISLADGIRRECLLVRDTQGRRTVVLSDPFDDRLLAWIDAHGRGAEICLVHADDLASLLSRHEAGYRAVDSLSPSDAASVAEPDAIERLSLTRISEDSSDVVNLVNATLYDALNSRASDIHFECTHSGLVIRYRIDGVLSTVGGKAGVDKAEQVISRIKVMAELDIAERRVPQDGRFKVEIKGREIDFRVSIMPSIFGEDSVLRILDKQELADRSNGVRLDALGFDGPSALAIQRLAAQPYGMILVTGPTGSGKTTTLYAMLSAIDHGQDKIVTIEDPVEYQLPGVLQIPVNEKKGLTFARGLRSILRHDPDKIMVGEIRDAETAQIAVQSALTGHLVFTTIHANNVFDVIGRFSQMGVDPYGLVSALNGIVAQRLVRMVCPHCSRDELPDKRMLEDSGLGRRDVSGWRFVVAAGCERCSGTGYRGRSAITEILLMDDEIRQFIIDRQPVARLKEYARQRGFRGLRESALDLVRAGRSTLAEVNRVTFVE